MEYLEEEELSLNPNRSKDMEECSFKDRKSSPVLGSSFGTLEFNELKMTLEDDSSSQHSTCNLPDFDLNIVILGTLQSPKIDSSMGLEGIDFDEEMSYTKVVSKKKKSQQKPRVTTHNRVKEDFSMKADCGGPPRSAGRKSNRWQREHESI